MYKRPDNPLQYLVDELERAREEEQQEQQVQTGKRDSSWLGFLTTADNVKAERRILLAQVWNFLPN